MVHSLFKKKYVILTGLCVLFLLTRIILLLSSEKLIFQGEERFVGPITQGIIVGYAFPVSDFQVSSHSGGSVANGFLSVPLFVLLGSTVLALRLSCILFYMLGLIFLYLFTSTYFNVRVALLSSLLYIFAPPLLMVSSFLFCGCHAESVVLSMMLYFLFFTLLFSSSSKKTFLSILLGIVSGLSVWYIYDVCIPIIGYLFIWFLHDKRFFLRKHFGAYCLSFLTGMIPWLLFNLQHNFEGMSVVNFTLHQFTREEVLQQIYHYVDATRTLFFKDLYNIFVFDAYSLFAGTLFNVVYYVCFLGALIFNSVAIMHAGCHREKNQTAADNHHESILKKTAITIVPFLFIFFYILSGYRFVHLGDSINTYRYSMILFPFIFITLALFLDSLITSTRIIVRTTGVMLCGIVLVVSVLGNGRFIHSLDFNNNYLSQVGCNYQAVGRAAFRRYGLNLNNVALLLNRLNDHNYIHEAYVGYGRASALRPAGWLSNEQCLTISRSISQLTFKNGYLVGLGEALACRILDGHISLGDLIKECETLQLGDDESMNVYRGILVVLLTRIEEFVSIKDLVAFLPQRYHPLAYFYYGYKTGFNNLYFKTNSDAIFNNVNNVNIQFRSYYYNGVGSGIAYFYSGNIRKTEKHISIYPRTVQQWLWQGVGVYFEGQLSDDKPGDYKLSSQMQHHENDLKDGIAIAHTLLSLPVKTDTL